MLFSKKSRAEREVDRLLAKARREDKRNKFFRSLGNKPMQYQHISVPDWDERTEYLSNFRKAYAEFFSSYGLQENSAVQQYSTQMFWHRLHLQKLRLSRLGITMEMESDRVQRSDDPEESLEVVSEFDGRFLDDEINEAIHSTRRFLHHGQVIGSFEDHDSVNYSILSAKQQGESRLICPSCGCETTREDLIDGCDYCGTKFTIEDLESKVAGFDFVFEIAGKGVTEKSRELRMQFSENAGAMVRKFDPNFSFWSFKSNIYNKMAAIHYADSFQEISAFASGDLSHLLGKFDEIVNIDFEQLRLWDHGDSFVVENGVQRMRCEVHMVLFGLVDGKIQLRNEVAKLRLEKSADCKTQSVCGPSVFRCRGCGSSLSLMDGKACLYCGKELDLKQYDWVITGYESSMSDYGFSWREYN